MLKTDHNFSSDEETIILEKECDIGIMRIDNSIKRHTKKIILHGGE